MPLHESFSVGETEIVDYDDETGVSILMDEVPVIERCIIYEGKRNEGDLFKMGDQVQRCLCGLAIAAAL